MHNTYRQTQRDRQNEGTERDIVQTKEQGKSPEKYLNESKLRNLLDKQFKVMVIKTLTDLRRRDEHSKNFNKEKI